MEEPFQLFFFLLTCFLSIIKVLGACVRQNIDAIAREGWWESQGIYHKCFSPLLDIDGIIKSNVFIVMVMRVGCVDVYVCVCVWVHKMLLSAALLPSPQVPFAVEPPSILWHFFPVSLRRVNNGFYGLS
jgi:hypothetical protein